jgi:hypothetical protein
MGLLSAAAKTALEDGDAVLAYLVELELATGTERYWTGTYDLSYDSQTWSPTGGVGRVGEIGSSTDVRANGVTLSMHGLPLDEMKAGNLNAEDYKGRPARFIFAMLQNASVLYAKPSYYYVDQLTYAIEGGVGAVQVNLEHETTYAARQNVRRYSDAEQQIEYPGDKAFEYLAYLSSGVEIRWGAYGSTFKD